MIFHMIVGCVAWLLATLGFRFYGQAFFYPDDIVFAIVFIVAIPLMWIFMVVYLGMLRVLPENRALAAISFCLPGMILDALVTANFALVFPNLDPSLDSRFDKLILAEPVVKNHMALLHAIRLCALPLYPEILFICFLL